MADQVRVRMSDHEYDHLGREADRHHAALMLWTSLPFPYGLTREQQARIVQFRTDNATASLHFYTALRDKMREHERAPSTQAAKEKAGA